jgi:hypothetical protein
MTVVRTDVLEEVIASIIRGTRMLVTAIVVPSSQTLVTKIMQAIHSTESPVLSRARQHNIQEDGILHHPCCLTIQVGKEDVKI